MKALLGWFKNLFWWEPTAAVGPAPTAEARRIRTKSTMSSMELDAAVRWRAYNKRAKEKGCFTCGEPNRMVILDRSNLGPVPVELWSCVKHQQRAFRRTAREGQWVSEILYPRVAACGTCIPQLCGGYQYDDDGAVVGWRCKIGPRDVA